MKLCSEKSNETSNVTNYFCWWIINVSYFILFHKFYFKLQISNNTFWSQLLVPLWKISILLWLYLSKLNYFIAISGLMSHKALTLRWWLTVWNMCLHECPLIIPHRQVFTEMEETIALWSQLWFLKHERSDRLWII